MLLLKILFFFDCFNMGLIWPFSSAHFSRSLAFNVKLETEDDDFISPFDLWNVSCCKIKLILIILIVLYAWWKCTDPVFCNENIKIITKILIYLINYYNVLAVLQFSQFVRDCHSLGSTAHNDNLSLIRKTCSLWFYVTSELKFWPKEDRCVIKVNPCYLFTSK